MKRRRMKVENMIIFVTYRFVTIKNIPELNTSRVKELGDLTSQIDLLTNSISENEWASHNNTPVPSIPCSPRDEIPPKITETLLPREPEVEMYVYQLSLLILFSSSNSNFVGRRTVAPVISD